tara:strand:- start:2638 stop:2775 length:138 start_codon:yes stop_codon:yes gene_type:complete
MAAANVPRKASHAMLAHAYSPLIILAFWAVMATLGLWLHWLTRGK